MHLGIKELRSLARDPIMLVLIVYAFTVSIYTAATAMPETLNKAPIAIVDEDRSPLSTRIVGAFYPPHFLPPVMITQAEMDARMDAGLDTFALNIPPEFQRDLLAGRRPTIQLNVDATRMSQAFTGSGYIQTIITSEVRAFAQRYRAAATAGRSGPAGALQPPAEQILVRRGDGGHQQCHHAVHRPHRRRADPRTGAWHRRASAGDAGDPLRDHDQQGLGHGAGGARRLLPFR